MDNPLLKPFHDLIELRHPESGERVSILPAEAGGCLKHVEVECRRDGETMFFILNVSPLEGSREQLLGYIVTLTDITERKKFRTQLLAINEELERRVEQRTRELQETHARYLHAEKLSVIGKLSASIAHEFNNPLQGIMSILQGFRRITMEDEDRAMLETAIAESVRMKNLVRNLQDFNRPSSGKKVLVDLHLSLNSLLLLCKSDFKRKRISLVLRYAEDLPQVLAIPDQIKQVFLNLLTNAADACFQSEGVITITTRREGRWVAVAIEDNGIGINPENLDLILQPFFTTKPEVKGTGLGLSISHGIIRSHRGEIRIESQPGKGSVFTVLLPIDGER